MQYATAHAFKAAMNLQHVVMTTDLILKKRLSFGGSTNF